MSKCLKPLPPNVGDNLVNKFGSDMEQMMNDIQKISKNCPMMPQTAGKRGKKNKTMKKYQKGGNMISAQTFKLIAKSIFVAILAYMLFSSSSAIQGIITGLIAIYSGECATGANRLWESIGFGNPICRSYNSVIRTIINALAGDPTSIATLGALVTIVMKSPFLLMSGVRIATYQMARLLPEQILSRQELDILYQDALGARPEIEAAADDQQKQQIAVMFNTFDNASPVINNISDSNNEAQSAAEALMSMSKGENISGGKRRMRNTKKSKKSRKAKKSRNVKKTRKVKKSKKTKKH